MTHKTESEKKSSSTKKTYEVTEKDLPLSCPMPNMKLWNAHPKVYLPIEKAKKVSCHYCGATYILKTEN